MGDSADRSTAKGDALYPDTFRHMVESAAVGMFQADHIGTVYFVNDHWRRITGYEGPPPIPASAIRDMIHPDDRERIVGLYLDSARTQREIQAEARFLRGDGTVGHVRLQAAPIPIGDAARHGMVGTVQDVTALVEATEARRRTEQHYRDLLAKAPVGQALYDADGTMIEVNGAWASLLGYEPAEVVGRQARDFVHPDDVVAAAQVGARLLAGELDSFHCERRMEHRDGSTVWVSSSTTLDRDTGGLPLHFHSIVFDITERRAAADDLRLSEQRYRKLVDELPVGQLISELDGRLVEVNQAFVRMLGGDRDELFERDPHKLFHPADLPGLGRRVEQLVSGEIDSFQMERRLVRVDGTVVWVSGGTSLLQDGSRVYLHSVLQDITERKLAEQALRESEARNRDVVEALHDAVIITSRRRVETCNRAARKLFRRNLEEMRDPLLHEQLDPIYPDGRPMPHEERPTVRAITAGEAVVDEVSGLYIEGVGRRWVNINAFPRTRDGKVIGAVTTFSDVTERKLAEEALRESETRFRLLAESLPVGVFLADLDGLLHYVNPRWCDITGLAEEEALGRQTLELIDRDDVERVVRLFTQSIPKRRPYAARYRIHTPAGEIRWISAHGAATVDDETGSLNGIIGSIEDITPLVTSQEETERLAGIVESTTDLVGMMDATTGELIYLNEAARDLFGYGDRDLVGVDHRDLYHPDAFRILDTLVDETMDRGENWTGELPMVAADGTVVHVWQTITAKRQVDGTIHQLASVGRDVTERRRQEEELAYLATHDSLTGLPNRALLLDHVELALARAERDGRLAALLFLDLDRFKNVNDTLGHEVGDALLAQVATRITEVLRPTDTVARLGGDEFVVLAEDVEDEYHAMAIAQRVAQAVELEPFLIGGAEVSTTGSIGIALAPGGPGAHPEALLRDADAAMYRAKELGRARLELFDESMRRRAALRLAVSEELAESIEHGRIRVHYQPCVDLVTGRVTAVEALARWEHPTRGLLGPSEFITLAEETGLIVGLGMRVLADACAQARTWQLALDGDSPRVHVNLSARQFTSSNLPMVVRELLDESGLQPGLLCLEITENVLMDDAASVITTLRELKDIGVSLAIDDFGTGYSSLSYLRRFPVDVVKVDQSFVDGLGSDPEDSAIVAAIVNLARTLDLEPVAEGVETPEQLEELRRLGCRGAQGYLFAHPAPPDEITPLLTRTFL